MEIYLTPELETELSQVAAVEGKEHEQLVREVLGEGLAAKAQFIASIRVGREAALCGDFVDSSALWEDVESILRC